MTLETKRLLLRELTLDDARALNEIESNPDVTRYMAFDPQSAEQTRAYLEAAVREQLNDPRRTYDLAVTDRESGLLIGRCGLGYFRPEHGEAAIWYLLHPAQHGRGYASEAASAVIDFAFGPLGLHRVWADCDPRNTASCRVAERLGMTLEGRLRENYRLKGEWCSTAVYAILEHEWAARRGPQTG